MKSRSVILAAALALAGAAVLFFRLRSHPSTPQAPPATQAAARHVNEGSTPTLFLHDETPANRSGSNPDPDPARPAERTRVGKAQVVATVNGVAITGDRLLGFGARDGDALPMSREMFEFLKQRAIDRELTVEKAKATGVELDAAQLEQVKQVRAQLQARGETDPAKLDFAESDARDKLLLGALLEKAGAPSQFAGDADVDRYYKEHESEFDALPADPAARDAALQKIHIQIRQKLYGEFQSRYQKRQADYLAGLRSQAQITN